MQLRYSRNLDLRQHLADRALYEQVGALASDFGAVDDGEVLAPEVVHEARGGVNHERRAADEKELAVPDEVNCLLEGAGV